MKYPYIGEGKNKLKYLVLGGGTGFILPCLNYANGNMIANLNASPEYMKNITREYLEGKCVKIESPEHSEFVQKLAFNAGFEWGGKTRKPSHTGFKYLFFKGDNAITCGYGNYRGVSIATIPLPPKAESEYYLFKDCEPKEWPQIGDKACYGNGVNCEVAGIHNEVAMILTERGDYHIAYLSELKKPKSEVEILRDDLTSVMDNSTTAFTYAEHIAKHLIDKYNITKKPQ